ncbi:C-X-C motif chemokine 6-like [Rhynchocyon petersi]
MSLRSSLAVSGPSPLGSVSLLLALLLLTPPLPLAHAGPLATVVRELRCMCLVFTPGVHHKVISKLQVIGAGPQCPRVEVIATLKDGTKVCLDPEAPMIKKIVQKLMENQ